MWIAGDVHIYLKFALKWWWWIDDNDDSALRKAPLLRYMSRRVVRRNIFSADRKDPMLSDGSRRWSDSRFQTIGSATENARRLNPLQRWRGTISWRRVADRRRWRLTRSFRKRRFRQVTLNNSAAAVRAIAKKSLIIANWKSTMRLPWSHRWTLCVTPKSAKGWLKTIILHLALPFICSLQVIVDISNLVCGLNVKSTSLQVTNRSRNGHGHVTWPIVNV